MLKKILYFLKSTFAKTPIAKNSIDNELKKSLSLSTEATTDVVVKKKRGRKKKEESMS